VVRLYDRPDLNDWSTVRIPVTLVVNQGNKVAHPQSSIDVAERLRNAKLVELGREDHFDVYHRPGEVAELIRSGIGA
jgi:pimeloyl-ACP methyl ester carboxylesterase